LPVLGADQDKEKRYLSEGEIKQKYRTCEGGWYSGPQPGKARFTKDPWLWVVTPEFAKRFCMPEAFVSSDLKGAEAVAFRLKTKDEEVICGLAGNSSSCYEEVVMRFELYIDSKTKIPKRYDGTYFQRPHIPSGMLITTTSETDKKRRQDLKLKPRDQAATSILDINQVGLLGVSGSRVSWPLSSLFQETFYAQIYPGLDYFAFEGSTGSFKNSRMTAMGIKKFVIAFRELNDPEKFDGKAVSEFAHVIELPYWYSEKIAEIDRAKGFDAASKIKEAFGADQKNMK
jgi:hypothetical protein